MDPIFIVNGESNSFPDLQRAATQQQITNIPYNEDTCRICATTHSLEFLMPIYSGDGLENDLATKINRHLPVQVSECDELPLAVCYQCTSTLLAWHELVECCIQADEVLRSRLQQPPQQEESVKAEPSQDTDDNDSDDEPLARLAPAPAARLDAFRTALLALRDHLAAAHRRPSADSEGAAPADLDYDDLSRADMRRRGGDEGRRAEVEAARRCEGGAVRYECDACGKRLATPHTYLFHRRIHTGERPCVCHVCGKRFRAPHGLRRHLAETHERRGRRACALCTRTFANSQNLKHHLRTHTGERPHACSACGKRFVQSGALHAHLRTHSPRRPHACLSCGAAFRLRAALVRHTLAHSGAGPHACELCPRTFRQRHELAAHRLAHADVRPHACPCGAAFRTGRALRRHQRRLHGESQPRDPAPAPALAPPSVAPNAVSSDRISSY